MTEEEIKKFTQRANELVCIMDSMIDSSDIYGASDTVFWALYNAVCRLSGGFRDSKSGNVNTMTQSILSLLFDDKRNIWEDYDFINSIKDGEDDEEN